MGKFVSKVIEFSSRNFVTAIALEDEGHLGDFENSIKVLSFYSFICSTSLHMLSTNFVEQKRSRKSRFTHTYVWNGRNERDKLLLCGMHVERIKQNGNERNPPKLSETVKFSMKLLQLRCKIMFK